MMERSGIRFTSVYAPRVPFEHRNNKKIIECSVTHKVHCEYYMSNSCEIALHISWHKVTA